jgi:hypothetical protein
MPPTPLPPPPQQPPTVIVPEPAHDLVNWLYANGATLAGVIAAAAAAAVAFCAIQRQIKAASNDAADQIKAASKGVADQIAAARKNQLRDERVGVAFEALSVVHDMYLRRGLWARPDRLPTSEPEPVSDAEAAARHHEVRSSKEERTATMRALAAKLYLFEMGDEAKAIHDFWQEIEAAWGTVAWWFGPSPGKRAVRYGQLIDLLKNALDK